MGAGISVITVVTIAYFAAKGVKSAASGHKHTVDRIIDSVVFVLIVRAFLTRKTSKPPKRMSNKARYAAGTDVA